MAVGLNIRFFILTTSVNFSFVKHGYKDHNHVLKLLIVHHHGKAQWILDKLFYILSIYAIHVNSSG